MIHFQHRNDVTSIVKCYRECFVLGLILNTKLDCACDVIFMLKINYPIIHVRLIDEGPF